MVRRRLPLLAAEGVTSCFISQALTTTLPISHKACDLWAWAESSISSHDTSALVPSALCVTAFDRPFFAAASILSAAAATCSAITGINHRGRVVQLEAQSLAGLLLSRDTAGGVVLWHTHEQSSALLPRYWASASAATLVQLKPSDTFGAAVVLSVVDQQPAAALTFNVTILIDEHTGLSCGSFSQYCVEPAVHIPAVSAAGPITIHGIKSWKLKGDAADGLNTAFGCLIDTDSGVWCVSFVRAGEKWTSSAARLFHDCSVAICVGLSSHEDCVWSICTSGSVSRAVAEAPDVCDFAPALQPWAQLPGGVERSSILVHAPDSMCLCVVSRTCVYLFFDCVRSASLVARGTLPSFPNSMHCWISCSGSMRICCVFDGHVRICSLGSESIYTQHLVHFPSLGANLGVVLDDKFYTSSHRGIARRNIDLKNNISFSASPRCNTRSPSAAFAGRKSPVFAQKMDVASDDASNELDGEDAEDSSPASKDEHSADPSNLQWIAPWYACLKCKTDYAKLLSSANEENKIAALSELLQPPSSRSSAGDWASSASPLLPPLAAAPALFTNMKERRANSTTLGAMLSAHCNGSRQFMWQSGWFVAWAALNEEQPQLLSELVQMYEERHGSAQASAGSGSSMSWACASWCGAPLWLTDTSKLTQLLMACGRAM